MSIRYVIWRHTFPYTSITPPVRRGTTHWWWVKRLTLVLTIPFDPTTWKSSTSGLSECWPPVSQKIPCSRGLRAARAPWRGRAGSGNPSRPLSGWAWWQWGCKVSCIMLDFMPYAQTTGVVILKLSMKGSQLFPRDCDKMEAHKKATSSWVAAAVSKHISSQTEIFFFLP